jgi:hypothetical protein
MRLPGYSSSDPGPIERQVIDFTWRFSLRLGFFHAGVPFGVPVCDDYQGMPT